MLGKSNLSKIIVALSLMALALATFSCVKKKIYYNTEIFCPDGRKILVKFAREEEIRQAILFADEQKRLLGTREEYTAIRMPHNKSFRIEKISPEKMVKCSLRESPMGVVDKNYVKYF